MSTESGASGSARQIEVVGVDKYDGDDQLWGEVPADQRLEWLQVASRSWPFYPGAATGGMTARMLRAGRLVRSRSLIRVARNAFEAGFTPEEYKLMRRLAGRDVPPHLVVSYDTRPNVPHGYFEIDAQQWVPWLERVRGGESPVDAMDAFLQENETRMYRPVAQQNAERLWWHQLELDASNLDDRTPGEIYVWKQVMRSIRPHEFLHDTPEGERVISFDEVLDLLRAAKESHEEHRRNAEKARREYGWEGVREALNAPDAEEVIEIGDWTGFTRGRARAWCWNLYQYEPRGFVGPDAVLRDQLTVELERGGVPQGFGYAAKAREYEERGLTVESYREAQEKLGRSTFSPADVVHS